MFRLKKTRSVELVIKRKIIECTVKLIHVAGFTFVPRENSTSIQ